MGQPDILVNVDYLMHSERNGLHGQSTEMLPMGIRTNRKSTAMFIGIQFESYIAAQARTLHGVAGRVKSRKVPFRLDQAQHCNIRI